MLSYTEVREGLPLNKPMAIGSLITGAAHHSISNTTISTIINGQIGLQIYKQLIHIVPEV